MTLVLEKGRSVSLRTQTPLVEKAEYISAGEYLAAQRAILDLWKKSESENYKKLREIVVGTPCEITLEGIMNHQALAREAYQRIMENIRLKNPFTAAHYLAWAYGTNNRKVQQNVARKLIEETTRDERFHPRNFQTVIELYLGLGNKENADEMFKKIQSPVKDYLIIESTIMRDLRN